jgi:hypothetical protein
MIAKRDTASSAAALTSVTASAFPIIQEIQEDGANDE